MVDGNYLPIVIVLIVVILSCVLLRKFKSICWWVSCPCLPVLLFIKKLVFLYLGLRVVDIPLGVIFSQFLNKSDISISVTVEN